MGASSKAKTKPQLERELLEAQIANTRVDTKLSAGMLAENDERRARERSHDYLHRVYAFTGPVNDTSVKEAIKTLTRWTRETPGCEITFKITSPGGSVIAGLALYDLLRSLSAEGHHITTLALGMAASMGAVLFQAGDTRIIGENAFLLHHEVSSGTIGKLTEMEDEIKFANRLQDKLTTILARHSTMSAAAIKRKWRKNDWWLDSDEAMQLGFADRVQ